MSEEKPSALPAAVSADILVYQNKQLTRLVRQLRRDQATARQIAESNEGMKHLHDLVSELEAERRKLYSRLYRLESLTPNHRSDQATALADATSPETENIDAPSTVRQESPQGVNDETLSALQKELTRVIAASGLAASTQVHTDRLITSEIELFNLNSDRNLWLQKATSAEKQLSDTTNRFLLESEKLSASISLSEKTFLTEIARLAEELAQRHHELRKYQAQVSELEQKLKESSHELPSLNRLSTPAGSEVDNASRLNELLRFKEEQSTRLLSQLVQLQQRITSLEQEIVMLHSRDRAVEELIHKTEDELTRARNTEEAQLEAIRALQDESVKEQQLRIAIEKDLAECRIKSLQLEETNASLQNAVKAMQNELDITTRNLREGKQQKLEGSSGKPVANSSLLHIELEELRDRVKCPLCQSRFRSVTLITCMHCFCRECVDEKMLNARNRKCPLCMQRFADADVRRLM